MNRIGLVAIAVVVVAAVGGGAFWAGSKFGENRVLQDPTRLFQQRAGRQAGQFPGLADQGGVGFAEGQEPVAARGRVGGGTMGTIEAREGDTLVVSTDEGTVRVRTSDATLVEKYMSVEVDDLEVGERVMISGSTNEDGSLTARSIQSMGALPTQVTGQE